MGRKGPNPNNEPPYNYIKPPDAGEGGYDHSATSCYKTKGALHNGWGRKRGADSSRRPFKTKGSWKFVWGTLSSDTPFCGWKYLPAVLVQTIFRGWWERLQHTIPNLAVLAAHHAAHLREENIAKAAPYHVDLIPTMRKTKSNQDNGSSRKLVPLIYVQREASRLTSFKY